MQLTVPSLRAPSDNTLDNRQNKKAPFPEPLLQCNLLILKMVLKGGLAQALAGGVIGAIFAPLAARSMASLLYGVKFGDPAPLFLALALVICAALLASFTPALGAARADPAIALRDE